MTELNNRIQKDRLENSIPVVFSRSIPVAQKTNSMSRTGICSHINEKPFALFTIVKMEVWEKEREENEGLTQCHELVYLATSMKETFTLFTIEVIKKEGWLKDREENGWLTQPNIGVQ